MYSSLTAAARSPQSPSASALTRREREVVERALSGAYNKLIAYDLGVCHSTIRVLMSRAASKLGVRTRAEVLSRFAAIKAEGAPAPAPALSVIR
jgi:DNA-binding NarL/FixJ family response regulator